MSKQRKQPKPDTDKQELSLRAGTLEFRAAEGDAPASVRMSVSSELPVETYVYFNDQWQRVLEILDHAPTSIDLSRCKSGLVVLDRHHGDQVGLIKMVETNDRKLGGRNPVGSGHVLDTIRSEL